MVFVYQETQGESVTDDYAAVPTTIDAAWNSIVAGEPSLEALGELTRLVTAMFLHGVFEHILYNMVFLWLFGTLVADHLGQWWALLIFLITGVVGNLLQVILNFDLPIRILGASGAVCGFEGVYLGLALRWQLPDPEVWPIAYPIPPLQLAALAVLGFFFDAYGLMNHDEGVAFGAHIGGLLSGVVIAGLVTTLFPTEKAYWRAGRTG
jgi:membrane associated rhomboid family serine protease